MNKEELIIGFFEKGYCCNLDEVKNTCLGLLKENQELKKQLENMTDDYCSASKLKHERAIKIVMINNQQKEFIKFLEDMLDDENDIFSVVRVKDVLQKYKAIIERRS